MCGELPILSEPSIRHGRFHPAVGPYPSRLRAVFAIRILEIGAAARVFRAPGLEGSGTITDRTDVVSSKEGFGLGFGDLVAPFSGTPSPTYTAVATQDSGTLVMSAQAILLIP